MPEPQPHEPPTSPGVPARGRGRRSGSTRPGPAAPTRGQARGASLAEHQPGALRAQRGRRASNLEQRIVEAAAALPAYGGVTGLGRPGVGGRQVVRRARARRAYAAAGVLATTCDDVRSQPGFRVSAEGLDPRTSPSSTASGSRRGARGLLRDAVRPQPGRSPSRRSTWRRTPTSCRSTRRGPTRAAAAGGPGSRAAARRIELADENSWSPQESPMRLVWENGRRPAAAAVQRAGLRPHGRHVGTPDLLDPVAGVVGEYDGSLHLQGAQRSKRRDDARATSAGSGWSTSPCSPVTAPTRDRSSAAARGLRPRRADPRRPPHLEPDAPAVVGRRLDGGQASGPHRHAGSGCSGCGRPDRRAGQSGRASRRDSP